VRDLLVFGVVMGCLPIAFRRPFVGLLLFSWLAYMRPQDLCWSFARDMRFSFLVGLTMLVGWFVHEAQIRKFWRLDVRTGAMLALVGLTTISLLLARQNLNNDYVMRYFFEFVKIIVVALFTTGQVDSKRRLRLLLWTICICLAFFGVKGGVFGVLNGGGTILRGPGGMLEDNNDFALALVMNIPLMFYLGRTENVQWLRRLTDLAVVLTLVTVLLTHSRGGFLAAVATLLVMAWRSRRLGQAFVVVSLATVAFFLLAPDHVIDRIASIGQGGAEASASARLRAWGAALSMIEDHPWLGVGLRNFQYHFGQYSPMAEGERLAFVAHNSFLQIWAESGTIAFVVYMTMLASVLVTCRYLRRLGSQRAEFLWIRNYALMFEATTVGFLVGAFFLNRGHFDLVYHWVALTSCLLMVARREVVLTPAADSPTAAQDQPTGIQVRRRSRGGGASGAKLVPRWGR